MNNCQVAEYFPFIYDFPEPVSIPPSLVVLYTFFGGAKHPCLFCINIQNISIQILSNLVHEPDITID